MLGLLLVAMGTYRSPAVAADARRHAQAPALARERHHQPDGRGRRHPAISACAAVALFASRLRRQGRGRTTSTTSRCSCVRSAIMFVAIAVLFLTSQGAEAHGRKIRRLESAAPQNGTSRQTTLPATRALPKPVKRASASCSPPSLCWFIGYNGVTTWFTTYVDEVMGQGLGGVDLPADRHGGAIVSYIPVGQIASKIGRQSRPSSGGILLPTICFALGYVLTTPSRPSTPSCSSSSRSSASHGRPSTSTPADGRRDVPGLGHRQVHRLLLSRPPWPRRSWPPVAGRHADAEESTLPRAVPLRRAVRRPGELSRHHALRPPLATS
ncbi:MAG: hypothetical protein ACLU3I_04410 [Acutalibacteraceae bacterium]